MGSLFFFFFQAEDGIRDLTVTGVQTCALPILINNAGKGADPVPLDGLAEKDWDAMIALNLKAAYLCSRAAVAQFKRAGQIGRASCRERVEISVVAVSLTKKTNMSAHRKRHGTT